MTTGGDMDEVLIRVIPATACGCGTSGCCSDGEDTAPAVQEGAT